MGCGGKEAGRSSPSHLHPFSSALSVKIEVQLGRFWKAMTGVLGPNRLDGGP